MIETARIDLSAGGERIAWTPAGFRGFTPRGRRLAERLGEIVRPEDRPAWQPSLTRWVYASLRELPELEIEIERVRFGADDGDTPEGAVP